MLPVLLTFIGCMRSCDRAAVDSAATQDSAAAPVPAQDVRVVVLVLDGVRVDESLGDGYSDVLDADTQTLYPSIRDHLLPIATVMDDAVAAGMTRTAPGHADLLSGRRVAFANYPNDTETPGAYLPEWPTLIDAIAPASSLLVTNSPLVSPVHRSASAQGAAAAEVLKVTGDDGVWDTLKAQLPGSSHRLVVANLHLADALAHSQDLDRYIEHSQSYDRAVLSFWRWLQEQPDWQQQTVLVVIADHGRHRFDTGEGWSEHGDHCVGCRQIPMLMVGPGVQRGQRISETVTLEDLGATLAVLMGVPLPYASGTPIAGALTTPPAPTASGTTRFSAAGGAVATEDLSGGQATISLDGAVVSSEDAFTAEAPRVATAGDAVYACWRELDLTDPDLYGSWPWRPRCIADGVPIDPDDIAPVWSAWRPALAADGGGLWMAWIDNVTGVAMQNSMARLSRWTEADGWDHSAAVRTGAYPDGIALHLTDDQDALIAFAESDADPEGRLGRRIAVHGIHDGRGRRLLRLRPDALEAPEDASAAGDRLEHPALWGDGDAISLAWVAYSADEDTVSAALWRADSADRGLSWSDPELVSGDILGHVTPAWTAAGALVWVTPSGELCRDDTGCTDLGSDTVLELGADGEAVQATALVDGAWARVP